MDQDSADIDKIRVPHQMGVEWPILDRRVESKGTQEIRVDVSNKYCSAGFKNAKYICHTHTHTTPGHVVAAVGRMGHGQWWEEGEGGQLIIVG